MNSHPSASAAHQSPDKTLQAMCGVSWEEAKSAALLGRDRLHIYRKQNLSERARARMEQVFCMVDFEIASPEVKQRFNTALRSLSAELNHFGDLDPACKWLELPLSKLLITLPPQHGDIALIHGILDKASNRDDPYYLHVLQDNSIN
ncbi:hypothetical protein VM1G_12085 [Cytospora mali]|uniref:Uncharacterized protein n=1 Tax=Cytospora mali TaxID=578113 RepID=A0A194VJV9_CYTMA|nr:hypothetical protein VM1G_12085 [Valsa mali]